MSKWKKETWVKSTPEQMVSYFQGLLRNTPYRKVITRMQLKRAIRYWKGVV